MTVCVCVCVCMCVCVSMLCSNKTNLVTQWSGNPPGAPTLTVTAATANSITLSVGRYRVNTYPSSPSTVSATYALYVYDQPLAGPLSNSPLTTASTTFTLSYNTAYTPQV